MNHHIHAVLNLYFLYIKLKLSISLDNSTCPMSITFNGNTSKVRQHTKHWNTFSTEGANGGGVCVFASSMLDSRELFDTEQPRSGAAEQIDRSFAPIFLRLPSLLAFCRPMANNTAQITQFLPTIHFDCASLATENEKPYTISRK